MKRTVMTAALAAGLILAPLACAASVAAQEAAQSDPQVKINLGGEAAPQSEARHYAVYEAAITDFNTGGFAALAPHLAGLREALAAAPATYPAVMQVDGGWVIHSDDFEETMILAQDIGMDFAASGGRGELKVVARPNIYPRIAFLLGSEALERRDFDQAMTFLDQGLALQPLDRLLLNEKLVVLHAQQRWDDAYALIKEAMAAEDPLLTAKPAHLQRRLGYTLVELGRIPEARAAYEASLVAEPGNQTALQELEFIAGLEAKKPVYGEMQITAPLAPRPAE
ncbi:tetratricopeptide repeat protein [Brevundimonas sp. Root1279]|uniref:tetratricopeptide repeat protein n=1 Tax=Brevundimonas sp. Root1279 TaxID=1736443 RepID=UPI0006FED40A|nr:tetratricopeptide repeat protein [Brevundimonas sp. Root1279]